MTDPKMIGIFSINPWQLLVSHTCLLISQALPSLFIPILSWNSCFQSPKIPNLEIILDYWYQIRKPVDEYKTCLFISSKKKRNKNILLQSKTKFCCFSLLSPHNLIFAVNLVNSVLFDCFTTEFNYAPAEDVSYFLGCITDIKHHRKKFHSKCCHSRNSDSILFF